MSTTRLARPQVSEHPRDGRAARAIWNNRRLTNLRKRLENVELEIERVRLLMEFPDLGNQADGWIEPNRRLASLIVTRRKLRDDIADAQEAMLQHREAHQ